MDSEQIRESVRVHYGELALRAAGTDATSLVQTANQSCCDDACCVPASASEGRQSLVTSIYSPDEVAGLPAGAIDAAAGCGNPAAIAELKQGEIVLDLGAGGGIDCLLAARQVGPSGRAIGVDMTPEMLRLARRNAAELGATNVEFRLGEIEHLPVADASVDVVISNCVINLSTDKQATLREAARVLRPGGRLRVSDIVWTREKPAEAGAGEEWAACISGALHQAEFLDLLDSCGFAGARIMAIRALDEARGLASAQIGAEKPQARRSAREHVGRTGG